MPFSLLLLLGVSLVILLVSVIVVRSKSIQEQNKLNILIILIIVFAVINTFNELRTIRPTNQNVNATVANQTMSVNRPSYEHKVYQTQWQNEFDELLGHNLLQYQDIKNSINNLASNKQLKLYFGMKGVGKTELFEYLADKLKKEKLPVWYMKCGHDNMYMDDLFRQNGFVNYLGLDGNIEKVNRNGMAPLIILDNVEYLLDDMNCQLCHFVRSVYDNRIVNIVMLMDGSSKLHIFQQSHAMMIRLQVIKFRSFVESQLNQMVDKTDSQWNNIDSSQLQQCNQIIKPTFSQINVYASQQEQQQTLSDYCRQLKDEKMKGMGDEQVELVKYMVRLQDGNEDKSIRYGEIKQHYKNSSRLESIIDNAIDNNMIYVWNGYYYILDTQLPAIL